MRKPKAFQDQFLILENCSVCAVISEQTFHRVCSRSSAFVAVFFYPGKTSSVAIEIMAAEGLKNANAR